MYRENGTGKTEFILSSIITRLLLASLPVSCSVDGLSSLQGIYKFLLKLLLNHLYKFVYKSISC